MCKNIVKILTLISLLFIGLTAFAAKMSGEIDSADQLAYDVNIVFNTSNDSGSATVLIEAVDAKNGISFEIKRQTIVIDNIVNGKSEKIAGVNINLPSKKDIDLTIHRRGQELGISVDNIIIYRSANIQRGKGEKAAATFNKWKKISAELYPLNLITFADNFMRTYTDINSTNDWEIVSGDWHLRSAWDNAPQLLATSKNGAKKISGGQNPFAWVSWGEPAIAVIGDEEWEDYTFKAAFRATDDSTFGVIVNYKDKDNYILATITDAGNKSADGNRINLYKVMSGQKTIIGSSKGGFLPGEWYVLSAQSTINGVKIFLDGRERISVNGLTLWYGQAGLYTYSKSKSPVEIDNVSATGRDLDFDVSYELMVTQINERFLNDPNGMEPTANPAFDWGEPDSSIVSPRPVPYRSYRTNVYADKLWILMKITPSFVSEGIINLVLNSTPGDRTTGYRAEINTNTNDGKSVCTLYQNDEALVTKTIDSPKDNKANKENQYLISSENAEIRFFRDNDFITLSINGIIILTAKVDPSLTTGFLPAFSATGRYPAKTKTGEKNPTAVHVVSYQLLDYTFDASPTEWLSEGTWVATTRWACDPEWSFLAGYSNGRVALWSKDIFSGDHRFQAYMGIKMEYPRENNTYYERYRELNV